MTDREKLFEIVKSASYRCLPSNTTDFHLGLFVTDLLSNGVTFATDTNDGRKWISVKDRLPEKDGYYLAFVEGYRARCTRLLSFAKDGRKVDEFDFDEGSKNVWYRYDSEYGYVTVEDVAHWMPLPEPPKEG